VAVTVWVWFAGVWQRVQPGVQVDFSSIRILLLDDGTVWRPPTELRQLWTFLRLLMLQSIWVVRCARDGKPFSSAAIIHRFRTALQQQLAHDWLRTQEDIRLNSGVPLSWLRGRRPVLLPERFVARWQQEGVFFIFFFGISKLHERDQATNAVPQSSGKRMEQPGKHHPVGAQPDSPPHGHTGDAALHTCTQQDSGPDHAPAY
jgi:hypothetical protein